ncbi:conserved hypothetical protein [Uncinocarpus reesii 1704]|uniref:CPL domain-containing protein n=1 Tax=Uncinocarpus reesii (strain UAMH 1704) TaxID=336963 RepID=C4JQT2_UNCRE|nr:uncharacterized protein UREG_03414 [Uncinocarpus reesii 1704]EEP78568.1 conserved hypothetical protein [Uncinocarpus reesii 1704]
MSGTKRARDSNKSGTQKKLKLNSSLPPSQYQTDIEQEEDQTEDHGFQDSYADNSKDLISKWQHGSNGLAAKTRIDDHPSKVVSKHAHVKQKSLTRERKSAKPNSQLISRTKKLWERLRLKSHVPREEREKLVTELYAIITGRVRDFVFKHDAVRVIQTALKYGTAEQRKKIALELKGCYRDLAESKYGKFLLAKLVVHGNSEIRDMIIPEFYGHVRMLIRHPEASWILDDIYRIAVTSSQKSMLLREWYSPEFAIFDSSHPTPTTSQLSEILVEMPEKRGPIMNHLLELINLLVQKKTIGFTMLHDAMLQYFLNTKPGSTDAADFMELLKGDEDGDLVKNLAFTKSGSRLMCLAFAHSNAKERKSLLRVYRDMIPMMAEDIHARTILLAAYEVIDDTKLTAKLIFPRLLCEHLPETQRHNNLVERVNHISSRVPLLYLFGGETLSWLLNSVDREILSEVRQARSETSKKDPVVRRNELIKAASPIMLQFISSAAEALMETDFGCRCITEVLFNATGEKGPALAAVAATVTAKPERMEAPFVGRMLKHLVQGGRYNPNRRTVEKLQTPLGFDVLLYECIKHDILSWLVGPNPFVLVAMAENCAFGKRDELLKTLKEHKQTLHDLESKTDGLSEKAKVEVQGANGAAAKLLLHVIDQKS